MTVQIWLEQAVADAERRGLPGLKTFLEALARTTEALRQADEDLRKVEAGPQSGRSES
jgi:hypothetical protein